MSSAPRVLAFLLLALPTPAQSLRLNGPLARGLLGEFAFPPQTSPDGRFLVYAADRDGDRVFELYSVRASGKYAPVRLHASVSEYAIPQFTSDGRFVLFTADLDGNGSGDLAIVPVDGTAPPAALSRTLPVPGGVGGVLSFQQSHDGARVVYLTYLDPLRGPRQTELSSVSIGGGDPVRLNGALAPGARIYGVEISSAGLVSYLADQDAEGRFELFVVPVDGGTPARKLPIPLVLGGSVALFRFDPDGSHIVYVADEQEYERYELFSIASDGSEPPRKLNGPLGPRGIVGELYPPTGPCWPFCRWFYYPSFHLSPDGRWVVYTANQDSEELFEVYGVPADGSRPAVKLGAASNASLYVSALTDDSAWVIYRPGPWATDELLSVPIDGSAPARRITGPAMAGAVYPYLQLSFDSSRVVYQADQDGVVELYSAPVDGSAPPVKLNAPLPPDGDVAVSAVSPTFWVLEGGVAYQAEQELDGLVELYFAPIDGVEAPRKLASGPIEGFVYPEVFSSPSQLRYFDRILFRRVGEMLSVGLEAGARPILLDHLGTAVVGDVSALDLAPAGDRAVYLAREQGDLVDELYSVPTSKPSARVQVREGSPSTLVAAPRLTSDGSRVVFLARRSAEQYEEDLDLYSAPADGSASPALLSETLGPDATVWDFEIAPDGRWVVFRGTAGRSLFSVRVDGSEAPVLLFASTVFLSSPRISADGSRVAFLEGTSALHTVPIDGSAPASQMSSTASPENFQLARDGSLVVYLGAGSGKQELYVAPSDGNAAPRKLNAPLQTRGNVVAFVLAPDATSVVYLADQFADEAFELFGVRVDGSAPPVRLHQPLAFVRDVSPDFQISSDSRRVIFLADARVNEQLDLFSVPIDASRLPIRLSGELVAGGDVLDYQLSPDGMRVVFRADAEIDEVVELFSTPVAGARGRTKLSRALVPGGDVRSFQLSADSRTVAFSAQRNATGAFTLLAVPIAGQEKAAELAGPFQGNGSVSDYRISADGAVVAYLADQGQPGVFELFAARRVPAPAIPFVIER